VKKLSLCVIPIVATIAFQVVGAQAPRPVVERLDAALDAIISPDSKLQEIGVGEHFGVTEGTIWVQDGQAGYLLFSDISANVIYKWMAPDRVTVFMEKSGYTGPDVVNTGRQSRSGRLYVDQLGSNGLTLDPQGRLVICAQGDRTLVRIERNGARTLLADRYEGKRLNGPNDVVVKSSGTLYFTDAGSGLRSETLRELPFHGLFMVKDGKVVLLDKNPQGGTPNGIAFSPDEKYLYVSAGPKIVRYDVQADDSVSNGRVFLEAGSDGMRIDRQGNLYTTTEAAVWITSPQGKHVGTIHLPQMAGAGTTNVGFGEADGKTLFIAARYRLYRIRVNVPGIVTGRP
jgi:gluconolactonase